MSTFTYHKPGIGNASSYLVSGIPFITSSIAPVLDETSAVVNFPRVTNYVVIKNTGTADVGLRVTFNQQSVVDNNNYFVLDRGESYTGDLRTTDVHLMSDGATPVPFTVVAGLTNIDRGEMTNVTPRAPNLLSWIEKQKLTASGDADPAGDFFGNRSLFLSSLGDILAIAARRDEENGGADAGSVYIFQSGSGGYQQVQKLTASGDANPAGDYFGISLSINSTGDILAIGASLDEENGGADAGSVYIFQSGSGGYQQVQKLTASGDANPAGDYFGISLSINSTGDVLAIGADSDEENGGSFAGSVYIFQSGSGGYQQVQKLTASGDVNPAGDRFGWSLSINSTGNILAIGANSDEENSGSFAGSVYIFQSGSGGYQQVQKLTASGDANPAGDQFGSSLSLDSLGNILAVGTIADEENAGSFAGSVYIFQSSSSGYQQVQKLTASGDADPAGDFFGSPLSLNSSGTILAVGAYADEENGGANAGSVYIFQSGSGGYQQVQKLTASGDADPAGDFFGNSLSLNSTGNTIAVGAIGDEENGGNQAGSVYIFQSGSGGYQQVQKLTTSFGTDGNPEASPEGDRLGDFIALNSAGTLLAAGARSDEENGGASAGSVYIFRYTRDY